MRVEPYPWPQLRSFTRAELRVLQQLRPVLARGVQLDALAQALATSLGGTASLRLVGTAFPAQGPPEGALLVGLQLADGSARLTLGLERALAQRLVAGLLGQAAGLPSPTATPGPAFVGALAALLVELGRRTGAELALTPWHGALPPPPCLELIVSVTLDERPYDLRIWLWPVTALAPAAPPGLARGSTLPIALPVVAAEVVLERALLETLEVGGALLPGAAWSLTPEGCGPVLLVAPRSHHAITATLALDGSLVVGSATVTLSDDAPAPDDPTPLGLPALQAPVLVRVEVASVSLSAEEWLRLRPGDVLRTDAPVPAPVVLRVAGVPVARGELVTVEGELGVKIVALSSAPEAP